ncbi:MAG: polysaccharide biosynthesis C-terminal domain-containing protein, partial [Chloroflexi bacterium]|nr:polysaccharide biosynthesis C-terminal domain-containing protein [Chloroflexota bacterium]
RPVLINLVTLAINLALSFLLVGPLHQGGLALAISVGVVIEAIALLALLQTRLPSFDWRGLFETIAKCVTAAAIMAVVLYIFVVLSGVPSTLGARILQLAIGLALGASVYFGTAFLMRMPELQYLRRIVQRAA